MPYSSDQVTSECGDFFAIKLCII